MFFFSYIFKQLLSEDKRNPQPKVIREMDEIALARRALQIQGVAKK